MSLTELKQNNNDQTWEVQKMCSDIDNYELTVEKQKTDWECEQSHESWKWIVAYHGSIVSSGSVNSAEEAMEAAFSNTPQ